MNLLAPLLRQVALRPEAPAILDAARRPERGLAYAQLDEQSARLAGLLEQRGLRPGDVVLVLQPMSLELYVALTALFRLGLVPLFVDPTAIPALVPNACHAHRPRGLIASPRAQLLRLFSPALQAIPVKVSSGCRLPGADAWRRAMAHPRSERVHDPDPDAPALITFTSGTTGRPKSIVRSARMLLAQRDALTAALELEAGEPDVCTQPIFLLANLAAGVPSLIPDATSRRPRPRRLADLIRRHAPRRLSASPTFLAALAKHCLGRGLTLPSLTRVFTGGAPPFPRLLTDLEAIAPNAEIVMVFGSSEAEPMARNSWTDTPPEERQAMTTGSGLLAGRPVPGLDLRIVDRHLPQGTGKLRRRDFDDACLPPEEAGEIVVGGPHVLCPAGGANTLEIDGQRWLRTGDAGRLDARGRLWLLGRCGAIVEDGRGLLFPLAVEAAAYHVPGVRRAALVGLEGRRLLVIEPEPDRRPDHGQLQAALAWAALDEIRWCRRLPVERRHHAKVDYPRLLRLLARDRSPRPQAPFRRDGRRTPETSPR